MGTHDPSVSCFILGGEDMGLALCLAGLITLFAYWKKSLSASGAWMAAIVGGVICLSNRVDFIILLLLFFVSSSILTRWRSREKKKIEENLYEKTGKRDWQQVLANGAVGAICAVLYWLDPQPAYAFAYYASFAVANADTWASEIGVLSKQDPISIIRFQRVDRGISGGVSVLGLWASLLGGLFIGIIYGVYTQDLQGALWLGVIGFLGSILDSILGAVFQPVYWNSTQKIYTEKQSDHGHPNTRIKGISWFTNDVVNMVVVVCGALLGGWIAW